MYGIPESEYISKMPILSLTAFYGMMVVVALSNSLTNFQSQINQPTKTVTESQYTIPCLLCHWLQSVYAVSYEP